ncbi:membrane protein insertion efficiency factor YidD [Nocardioides antri]|uniref:Putative membrane protein insertion efficiency factor n=1 Tax=Nocardioides antri TaxID=2607659 RepID=A0A5B1M1Y0_9ACTN|nr:membrane protein insertion efficiency factor YidD [Nocardioides antri]
MPGQEPEDHRRRLRTGGAAVRWLLVALLRGYRAVISPIYGEVCRYYPSCSAYALEAVRTHGSIKGSWLAVRRVARCHPWAAGGVDHVPPRSPRGADAADVTNELGA